MLGIAHADDRRAEVPERTLDTEREVPARCGHLALESEAVRCVHRRPSGELRGGARENAGLRRVRVNEIEPACADHAYQRRERPGVGERVPIVAPERKRLENAPEPLRWKEVLGTEHL